MEEIREGTTYRTVPIRHGKHIATVFTVTKISKRWSYIITAPRIEKCGGTPPRRIMGFEAFAKKALEEVQP